MNVLEKGLKFGIKTNKTDEFEILSRFELVAQQFNCLENPSNVPIEDNKKVLQNLNMNFLH